MPTPRRHQASSRALQRALQVAGELECRLEERLDSRLEGHGLRLMATAVAAVTLLGIGAASAGQPPVRLSHATAVAQLATEVPPTPIRLAPAKAGRTAKQAVTGKAHPAKGATTTLHVVAAAATTPVKRWLPTGTGMWIHDYDRSEGGNGRLVVARAQRSGLSHVFVQTGSSKKGWIGSPTLRSLLPATKGTEIKVIAWDFPKLNHPVADARRMAMAAYFRCAGCPRVAAVAPDVETAAEGTRIGPAAVRAYYAALRQMLPPSVAILATVPWPSESRVGRYPYASTAPFVDALLPMAYWYNRDPAIVTGTSIRRLKKYGKPIMPVGQGYDGRIDAPYLAADPHPGLSVTHFLTTARNGGAKAVSLWSWQTTGGAQWRALSAGHAMFAPAPSSAPGSLSAAKRGKQKK